MFKRLFKSRRKRLKNKIISWMNDGWVDEKLKSSEFIDGFIDQIIELNEYGIDLESIKEYSFIGQIEYNKKRLAEIKVLLSKGEFQGGIETNNFCVDKDYVNLEQIVLLNDEVYAIATISPAEINIEPGIFWMLKMKNRIDVKARENCFFMYRKID